MRALHVDFLPPTALGHTKKVKKLERRLSAPLVVVCICDMERVATYLEGKLHKRNTRLALRRKVKSEGCSLKGIDGEVGSGREDACKQLNGIFY